MRWYTDFYKGQTKFVLTYSDHFLSEKSVDELYFIDRYTGKISNNNNESALPEGEVESTKNVNDDNNSFNIMWLIGGGICIVGCIVFLFLSKKFPRFTYDVKINRLASIHSKPIVIE